MTHTIFERYGNNGRMFVVKGLPNKVKMLNTWKRNDGKTGATSVLLRPDDVDELIDVLVRWRDGRT